MVQLLDAREACEAAKISLFDVSSTPDERVAVLAQCHKSPILSRERPTVATSGSQEAGASKEVEPPIHSPQRLRHDQNDR